MPKLIKCAAPDAKSFLLRSNSYSTLDLPEYIDFQPTLLAVDKALSGKASEDVRRADTYPGVNHRIDVRKDDGFECRPIELIHPVIYVSLVNLVCAPQNWLRIQEQFARAAAGSRVTCCSPILVARDPDEDTAKRIMHWWSTMEQGVIEAALDYSHLSITDVADCYGSIRLSSVARALSPGGAAGACTATDVFGEALAQHLAAGRCGHSSGIPQGSVLMDLVAELLFVSLDLEVSRVLPKDLDVRILRYRDDYRILAHCESDAKKALSVIAQVLKGAGMRLNPEKTSHNRNVIEGALKPDKRAAFSSADLEYASMGAVRNELMKIHAFGRQFPNSGSLKRLLSNLHMELDERGLPGGDVTANVSIVADMAAQSPQAIPVLVAILSVFVSQAPEEQKARLWSRVCNKLLKGPFGAHSEIWLQRAVAASKVDCGYVPSSSICRIASGADVDLWESGWLRSGEVGRAISQAQILSLSPAVMDEVVSVREVAVFRRRLQGY